MKHQKAKFSRPLKIWSKKRIEVEGALLQEYGLRRMKELWRAEAILGEWRHRARELAAHKNVEQEKVLIKKLQKLGLLKDGATLDNILQLETPDLLSRRLQTLVYKKGFAQTHNQARQFIVHGHVAINGTRQKWPSTLVAKDDEEKITFYVNSKVRPEKIKQTVKEVKAEKEAVGITEQPKAEVKEIAAEKLEKQK